MMPRFISIVLLFVLATTLKGQCLSNSYRALNVNKVEARFTNDANHFWDRIGYPEYFVPKGSTTSPVFVNGMWIGGLSPQGQIHMAASLYRQQGADFYTGPYRDPIAFNCEGQVSTQKLFPRGLKRLTNGKILLMDSVQIQIYDPATSQVIVRLLPASRRWLDALELADGRIMIYGDDTYPNKNPILLLDTVNYHIGIGPQLVWFHLESTATQLPSGKVLVAGVVGCELFDPLTSTSVAVPDMLYARRNHAAVLLPDHKVHVFGGGSSLNGTGLTIRSQYFDDSLGHWLPGPDMNVARNSPDVVDLLDGTYLITGGSTSSGQCEIFDRIQNTITPGPALPVAMNRNNAALLPDGWVAVAMRDNQSNDGGLFLLNPTNGAVEHVCIYGLGPQLALIDSTEAIVGYDRSYGAQRVQLRQGYQTDSRWQYLWSVTRAEIDQFRADHLANDVDFTRYPHIESWPAHGSVSDGEDRNLAPFVDVNLDGFYRPYDDGDYPCIVGDQALWWVFNDQGPHTESGGLGMGLQIEAMAYAFDCAQTPCPDTSLDYATFVHYEITNHSDTAWNNMYVSGFYDVDMGGYFDDFVGSDSASGLGFVYNADNTDDNYGTAPPAWGVSVLPNGEIDSMTSFMTYQNTFAPSTGNPQAPEHFYNYQRGTWRDGMPLVNNGLDGYPGTAAGPRTHFIYSSTDGFCGGSMAGWSELTAGSVIGDRTFLASSGPFQLQPGASISYDICHPYARAGNNTESVCALKTAASTIRQWWQTQLDRSCFDLVVAQAEQAPLATMRVVPNPVTGNGFALEIGEALEEDGILQVVDCSGRTVQQKPIAAGSERWLMNTAGLTPGMYLLRLTTQDQVRAARVVIY